MRGGKSIQSVSTKKQCMNLPVLAAENILRSMGIITGNIVLTTVTYPTALERSVNVMNDAYRVRLENYLASMLQAKQMMSMGILTSDDYAAINTILAEKYGISSCSLYRGIDLIYDDFRGNMSYCKEVTQCQEK